MDSRFGHRLCRWGTTQEDQVKGDERTCNRIVRLRVERVAHQCVAFITPLRARSKAHRTGRHLEQLSADDKISSGHFCLSIGARVIAHPVTGVA